MIPHEITTTAQDVASGMAWGAYVTFSLVWLALILVAGWKLYSKAGQPGWLAIVPILNVLGMLQIAKRPLWWLVLLIVPVVNVVVLVIVLNDISKAFGHGFGMTLLLIFLTPIGYLLIGFGASEYQLEKEPLFS